MHYAFLYIMKYLRIFDPVFFSHKRVADGVKKHYLLHMEKVIFFAFIHCVEAALPPFFFSLLNPPKLF